MAATVLKRTSGKTKPFRDALMLELSAAGEDSHALRKIARALMNEAAGGNIVAAKELADRVDGKVAQALIGGDDEDTQLQITVVNYTKDKPLP